ncbi:MAG: phage tail tape measure protein, partial [Clostridia bacterium]
LAVAGFTDVDTAVGATAKVLNAYKMDVSETDRIHKILMATQNKGITTVGELSASLAQVTPTAAAMGVSFEQVGAALATMTAQGTPTAQATTQLNSLFAELGKSGTVAAENLKKATEGTRYAGMSFQDMMTAGVPLNEVLDQMGGYADANGLSLLDMFSSIEAGKAALAMAGENAGQYTTNLAAMSTQADIVDDAYAKMMDTLEGQASRLKESAKNLGISIYNGASGKLKDMAKLGNSYIDTLQKAFSANGLKGLTSALGNVLSDVVSKASDFAPQMTEMAVELIDSLAGGIVDNADNIAEGIADALEAAINGMARIIPNMLAAGLKIAMKLVEAIVDSLPMLIPQVIEALVNCLVELVTSIPDLLLLGLKIASAIAEGIITSIPKVFEGVGEAFKNLFTNADEIAEAYAQQFKGTSEAYETFKQALADADTKFNNAVQDAQAKKQLATDMLTLYNELAEKDIQTDADITLMAEYAAKIAELYPSLAQYISPATGLFTENTTAILQNIDAMAQLALVNAYKDYRDSLYTAMADADMALREHAGELQSTKDKISDLTATKDDLDGFMKNVFSPGIDNGYEEFKNNLIDIYGKITEATGIENPWGNYFTQLADGSLQLKDGAQWVDAYTEANALLSLALS